MSKRKEVFRVSKKLEKLSDILKATDTKAEFDIVEDLEQLLRMYGVLRAKDYKKKLSALIEKYKTTEITEIRSALLERCRKGDTNAIRLYCDYFKDSDAEVTEDNGLIDALNRKANEVFIDED